MDYEKEHKKLIKRLQRKIEKNMKNNKPLKSVNYKSEKTFKSISIIK